MKFKYIFLIIFLLMPLALAQQDFMKPAELNKPYNIIQTCENATFVNITVANKDRIIIENTAMADNSSFNWIFQIVNTQTGRHDVTGVCDVNGINKPFATYYEVTGTGFTDTSGFYFLIIILSLGIITLGFYAKDATITILGTLGFYFLGLYILFYGIDGIKDTVYTWGIGIIILGCAMYISSKAVYEGYLS